MQLIDPRLEFAKPLIDHWCSIRGGELVPREENLRPTILQQILPMTQILDISKPGEAYIALMGKRIRSRYPPDRVRPRDWYSVLPKEAVEEARKMTRRLADTPCGIYYRYRLVDSDLELEEGEALALPMITLKHRSKPSAWISLLNVAGSDKLVSPPASLGSLTIEYVDIGAGLPDPGLTKEEQAAVAEQRQ